MSCSEYERSFDGYLEETLSEADLGTYEAHLTSCKECADALASYRETERFLSSVALPSMPDELWRRQRAVIAKSISLAPLWTAPSYSLGILAAILGCYIFAGFDWLFISFGDFLGLSSSAVPGGASLSFDGFDTVILLYLGLFTLEST